MPKVVNGSALLLVLTGFGCSLLAPSDDELTPSGVPREDAAMPPEEAGTVPGNADAKADADAAGGAAGGAQADAHADVPIIPVIPSCPNCVSPETCVVNRWLARCENPAAALENQRWDLPCGAVFDYDDLCYDLPPGATACPSDLPGYSPVDRRIKFGGQPGTLYEVTLHFRGIVEPKTYTGGAPISEQFYGGGSPVFSSFNVYSLSVSAPAMTYYLNSAEGLPEGRRVFRIDYRQTILIEGSATLHLSAYDSNCSMVRNCTDVLAPTCVPLVIPDVPPAPQAYNGQFVQMNVVSVKPRTIARDAGVPKGKHD